MYSFIYVRVQNIDKFTYTWNLHILDQPLNSNKMESGAGHCKIYNVPWLPTDHDTGHNVKSD